MQINFVSGVVRQTLALSLLIFCTMIYLKYYESAFSILLGSVWGCVNLAVLKKLIESSLLKEGQNFKILSAFLIKFPLLYVTGYLVLASGYFLPASLLIGTSLIFLSIFFVITSKALERA